MKLHKFKKQTNKKPQTISTPSPILANIKRFRKLLILVLVFTVYEYFNIYL